MLAEDLGFLYFDTGVMYRAVAWAALDRGIAVDDEAGISELAETLRIAVRPPTVHDGRQYTVLADDVDITWEIRSDEVNRAVSPVSTYRGVRRAMTEQQRRIAADANVIMAGRDIGTVVLPNADVKIYLDASVEERANRRLAEEQARGHIVSYDQVLADLMRRDKIDSTRKEAPLAAAADAVIVDSTDLTIEEVVSRIRSMVNCRLAKQKR
jgi:cytidylate kinase